MKPKLLAQFPCICLVLLTIAFGGGAWADCGSVPFYAPAIVELDVGIGSVAVPDFSFVKDVLSTASRGLTTVSFDPLQVTVFEPSQKAIVLWNGNEQILLLSTDQRASQRTAVLEVIPLPSEPKVRLGSFETFEKAQRLVVKKRMWAVAHGGAAARLLSPPPVAGRISFEKKMGAHDLSVAEVLHKNGFVEFVQNHLKSKYGTPEAPIRPEFVQMIDGYLQDGYRWFAFDVIALDEKDSSREPIEYRFKTDSVFYPMRISTLEEGETKVDMLVFTQRGISTFEGLSEKQFDRERTLEVDAGQVDTLAEGWRGFFGEATDLVLDQWSIEGDIGSFKSDVIVR
jgi:hypothetical protein